MTSENNNKSFFRGVHFVRISAKAYTRTPYYTIKNLIHYYNKNTGKNNINSCLYNIYKSSKLYEENELEFVYVNPEQESIKRTVNNCKYAKVSSYLGQAENSNLVRQTYLVLIKPVLGRKVQLILYRTLGETVPCRLSKMLKYTKKRENSNNLSGSVVYRSRWEHYNAFQLYRHRGIRRKEVAGRQKFPQKTDRNYKTKYR